MSHLRLAQFCSASLLLLVVSTTTAAPLPLGNAGTFVVQDQIITDPKIKFYDPEFDQPGQQVVWMDDFRNLWVAQMNADGAFIPSDGRGTLVDIGVASIDSVGNGPEWAYAAGGSQVVYTKQIKNNYFLARAIPDPTQTNGWRVEVIANSKGDGNPFGSKDRNDLTPRIRYIPDIANRGRFTSWLELNNPAISGAVADSTVQGGRWIEGLRAMTVTIQARALRQVAQFDIDSGVLTQLTFGSGAKAESAMWPAPEFNNEYVLLTLIDQRYVGIYRKINGMWTQVNLISPPSPELYIGSPEPFVYNGKSYVSYTTARGPGNNGGLSDVWIAAIDPTEPLFRKVSGSAPLNRVDPETYQAPTGMYVYYTEQGKRNGESIVLLHRCATGLGLPLTGRQ